MAVGLAHVKYIGSSGLEGGWTLHLDLTIDYPKQQAFGTATLTRAVPEDPVVTFPPVSGPVITMATMKDVHIGLRLQSDPKLLGRQIDVNAVMHQDMKSGGAVVHAFLDTPDGRIMFHAKLSEVA